MTRITRKNTSRPAIQRWIKATTIHMCTADDEGNMVSLIQSNYRGMGSGIVVPSFLYLCSRTAANFLQDRSTRMFMRPGEMLFYTIIPGFVMKGGKPWEAFGLNGRRHATAGARASAH